MLVQTTHKEEHNMKITNKILALALAATICLSLLLSACTNGSSSPSPTVTDAATTPGGTESPSNTPDVTTNPSPDTSTEPPTTDPSSSPDASGTPVTPKNPEPEEYNATIKADLDKTIVEYGGMWNFDIDDAIDKAYATYGKYLNEKISMDAMRIGVVTSHGAPYFKSRGENPTGISPDAMKKVNSFLADNGEEALDSKIPEQNVAAFWIAASLYYDPNVDNGYPAYDIAMPFGLARADSSPDSAENEAENFWSSYVALFDLLEGYLNY